MHFVKFETARVDDCLDFIQAKGLHRWVPQQWVRRAAGAIHAAPVGLISAWR
jgi:hypothetical protein